MRRLHIFAALLARIAGQDVVPPAGATPVLLDLELTVDGMQTKLTLVEGQSYLDAARKACHPVEEASAIDNCVGGARRGVRRPRRAPRMS